MAMANDNHQAQCIDISNNYHSPMYARCTHVYDVRHQKICDECVLIVNDEEYQRRFSLCAVCLSKLQWHPDA